MDSELKLLMSLKIGEEVSEFWLIETFGKDTVVKAKQKRYIEETDKKTQFGDPCYRLAELGICARDRKRDKELI